jgi:hypothetical protein
MSEQSASRTAARSLWIANPWIDLVVGCGGWSLPLLLASYWLVEADARRWSAVFYAFALACNYPHYMATIHRAYFRHDDRQRYRLFTHHFTAALLLVGVVAHVQTMLLAWLFTIYVMWSPWHYTGQNFGLLMMQLRRGGAEVSPAERQRLRIAFVASYVMLLAAFNEQGAGDPLVLSLNLPSALAWPIQAAAALVFVAAGLPTIAILARRSARPGDWGWRAAAGPVTLFATQTLWFVAPIALTWTGSMSLPQTRYSSGILAIMHSAQYLWITQHYARRDAALRDAARQTAGAGGPDAASAPAWSGLRYWSTLIVGGIALFVPGPWLASYAGHVDFTSSMLIVTALVNIHHFVLDGVVWKLRDARVATVLVQPADAVAVAPHTPLGSASASGGRGQGWPAWLGRGLRVAAVCGLVSLAAVDQWRYRLSVRESDPAALGAAQRLNPWDNPVYLRLAAAGVAASADGGDRDAAVRELERAIEAHQDSPAPYQALSRILIESGRLGDAYAVTRAALVRSPTHVESLVNAGVLASRLGYAAEAEQWWRLALQQNAGLVDVELYLAELLDAARPQDALPHYQRHLELVAKQGETAKSSPQRVALIVVKFGDALARTGQRDLALSQYDLAERIAVRTGLTDVAALARDHRRGLTE